MDDSAASGVWFPILQSMGPALLQEARKALEYGERMVRRWPTDYMFAGDPNAGDLAQKAAAHFDHASTHKSHGRRIDRAEARDQRLCIEDLEANQDLQDAILTLYHLVTIWIEKGPTAKLVCSDHGKRHIESWMPALPRMQEANVTVPAQPAPAR